MCGIAGIFGASDERTLRAMLGTLVHRGPDDQHQVVGEGFCLGARRLSIVDLEGGRQPIANESGRIWVAQNGEIYNFPELRPRFLKSHVLRTRCDTEILAHAYEDHGEEFVQCLNGMYAIALWDAEKSTGILARDRVGKKPLYYCLRDGALYFASEIKALLAIPGFVRRVNLEALHHYLSYRHVPCPLSIFEGIHQLPPAHTLRYRRGASPQFSVYWRPDFSPEPVRSPEKLVDRMEEALKKAVRRRLMSDVPVGLFLSGGIDSGLVTALAAEVSPTPVQTFTLTYAPGSETVGKQKDREFARVISEKYGTVHHEETIQSAYFPEELPRILSHFDEPFAGVVSPYFLSPLIRKHVKVAVSGDGADELFGSYLSHRVANPIARHARGGDDWTGELRSEADRDLVRRLASKEDGEWRYRLLTFTDEEKRELYTPPTRRAAERLSTAQHLRKYFAGLTAGDPLNRILEMEFRSFLPDQILTYADRLSMAHSLESRSPYLDFEFVELAARIPGDLKIHNGETKYILKKLAERYLPEEVVYRPKEGFVMPVHEWLRRDLEDYVRSTLSAERLARHGYFEPEPIQKYVDDYYRGKEALGAKIQTLLAFQVWHELYIP